MHSPTPESMESDFCKVLEWRGWLQTEPDMYVFRPKLAENNNVFVPSLLKDPSLSFEYELYNLLHDKVTKTK